MEFTGPSVDWYALTPLLVLLGGGLLLLVVGALTPRWPKGWYAFVTASTAGAAGVLAILHWHDLDDTGPGTLVGGALAFDRFAQFVTITICAAVVLVATMCDDDLRSTERDGPEVYALVLMAALGGVVMGAANDLIVLFLGLESLSLALYVLVASDRRRATSQEGGIKYFVLGGFSSAFFLYGIALLYGGTGSTNISEIVAGFQSSVSTGRDDSLILAGIALLLVGLAFKVAAVPFHVWTPDVYQGAPTPITALMASLGKTAAFAAVLRVLVVALPFHRDDWRPVVWVLAVLSLVVAPAIAIVQTDLKRMLAYSSIGHVGFMLVALEAAGHRAGEADPGTGMPALLVYLLVYSVLTIGTWSVVATVSAARDGDTGVGILAGLGAARPAMAVGLTVLLVAQAGVPFTSGFVAKFGAIQAAVQEESYALAIIGMVAAVIAAVVYLRVMVTVWMTDAPATESADAGSAAPVPVPVSTAVVLTLAVAFTIAVGLLPAWLIDAAATTTP